MAVLRDVRETVLDGQLGFSGRSGSGISVRIGPSPIVSDKLIIITGDMTADTIKERLGRSPLADSVMDSVQFGAARVYCLPVAASTAGTVGEVEKEGKGGGTLTASGSPYNAFAVVVRITAQGTLNTAAFTYSIDGGNNFSDEITVPVAGKYELPGTGLTLTFAAAQEEADSSFQVGDMWSFSTTAPAMTKGDALAAARKIKDFSEEFEWLHVVGGSDLDLCEAMGEVRNELATEYHKPLFILMEAAYPTGDLTDWALGLENARGKVKNTDIQVCTAWGRLVRLDGSVQIVNLAGIVSGLYAKAGVAESIGKTRPEAGFGISPDTLEELLPAGLDDYIIKMLDEAGFLTFRSYAGLEDFFVYHAKVLSPEKSDFQYAEDIRVKNKVIREVRKEALLLLNDDIDMTDFDGETQARAKFLTAPLDRMVAAKEISRAEVTIPEGQAESFLETGLLRVRILYLSRGYIREIEIEVGRTNVSD